MQAGPNDGSPLPRPMDRPAILVVTGPSGAGKTAAVERLQARGRPGVRCHFFDRIGVPSAEVKARSRMPLSNRALVDMA